MIIRLFFTEVMHAIEESTKPKSPSSNIPETNGLYSNKTFYFFLFVYLHIY